MKINTKQSLEYYARDMVGHSVYMLGAQGEDVTSPDALIKLLDKLNITGSKRKRTQILWQGIKSKYPLDPVYAFDCSGLIVRWMLDNKVRKEDTTADGLHDECNCIKVENNVLRFPRSADLINLVFKVNEAGKATHVGIATSAGTVIHAKGSLYGVVEEPAYNTDEWTETGAYPGSYPFTATSCAIVCPSIGDKSEGMIVRMLQLGLNNYFLSDPSYVTLKVDGLMGPKTRAAISKYSKLVVMGGGYEPNTSYIFTHLMEFGFKRGCNYDD